MGSKIPPKTSIESSYEILTAPSALSKVESPEDFIFIHFHEGKTVEFEILELDPNKDTLLNDEWFTNGLKASNGMQRYNLPELPENRVLLTSPKSQELNEKYKDVVELHKFYTEQKTVTLNVTIGNTVDDEGFCVIPNPEISVIEQTDNEGFSLVPDAATSDQATSDYDRYKKAINTIEKNYKKHRKKIEGFKNSSNPPWAKYQVLRLSNTRDGASEPIYYFFDKQHKLPPVRIPNTCVNNLSGSSKVLIAADQDYVKLQSLDSLNSLDAYQKQKKSKEIHSKLAKFPTVMKALPVNDTTTVAVNGGESLQKMMSDERFLPISVFFDSCHDLSRMHKENIFLNDIKPDNLVFKSFVSGHHDKNKTFHLSNPQVHFIDVDDAQFGTESSSENALGTPLYLTKELWQGKKQENVNMWRAADNYAKLLSIAATTSSDVNQAMLNFTDIMKEIRKKAPMHYLSLEF